MVKLQHTHAVSAPISFAWSRSMFKILRHSSFSYFKCFTQVRQLSKRNPKNLITGVTKIGSLLRRLFG